MVIKNNNKKYIINYSEPSKYFGSIPLYQIQAIIDIPKYNIKAGDFGGYIQSEYNLSHSGSSWISNNAMVFDNAVVVEDALVSNNAIIFDSAWILNDAFVTDSSIVADSAWVADSAQIKGYSSILNNSCVFGNALITGNTIIKDSSRIYENAQINGEMVVVEDYSFVCGKTIIKGDINIKGKSFLTGNVNFSGYHTLDSVDNRVKIASESFVSRFVNNWY